MLTQHPFQTFLAKLWRQYLSPLEALGHIYLCPELHAGDTQVEDPMISADSLLPVATAVH